MSEPSRRTPAFAAVIAHADDAAMLRRCVAHHLAIGVDYVFVSLNLDDPESAAAAAELTCANVRAERLAAFAPDPFHYFTAALRAASEWVAPDWLLFVDSDEFWIPASGSIRNTAALDGADAYSVPRFNVPPVRGRDGTVRTGDAAHAERSLVIAERRAMTAEALARSPQTPWLYVKIGPKLMVRPEIVASVGVGAHEFVPARPDPRVAVPHDLLIVHLPFTTEARFRRKLDAVRARLTAYDERYEGSMAWHWRRWIAVDDAGGASAEFAAQCVDEADVPALVARGVLTTPERLFADGRLLRA